MKKFLTYSSRFDQLTAEEEQLLNEDTELIEKAVAVSRQLNKKRIATRNAHAKAFGFVRGNFIPVHQQAGDFSKLLNGSNLGVILRYSHPNFLVAKGKGEYPLYGCAVKIYNKELPVSAKFPLVNFPVFITNSVAKFLKLHIRANQFLISKGSSFSFSFLKIPGVLKAALSLFFDREILPILNNTVKMLDIEKHLISGYTYHSVGCFRLEDRIVKIRLIPSAKEKFKPNADIDQATALRDWFMRNEMSLDFQVQLATDEKKTPVNNLLKQWKEKHSEFITIGKIILPKQDISRYSSNMDYENLSFNPFENTEALQPVGRMQKIRQEIYNKSVATRQSLNQTL